MTISEKAHILYHYQNKPHGLADTLRNNFSNYVHFNSYSLQIPDEWTENVMSLRTNVEKLTATRSSLVNYRNIYNQPKDRWTTETSYKGKIKLLKIQFNRYIDDIKSIINPKNYLNNGYSTAPRHLTKSIAAIESDIKKEEKQKEPYALAQNYINFSILKLRQIQPNNQMTKEANIFKTQYPKFFAKTNEILHNFNQKAAEAVLTSMDDYTRTPRPYEDFMGKSLIVPATFLEVSKATRGKTWTDHNEKGTTTTEPIITDTPGRVMFMRLT